MGIADFLATILNEMFKLVSNLASSIGELALVSFQPAGQNDMWGYGLSKVWSTVISISNNVTEPIAVYIVLIMFLLSTIDRVSTEQFTLESLLKDLIKFCMGIYLVTNAVEIVVGCIKIGNLILIEASDHMFAVSNLDDLSHLFTGDALKTWGGVIPMVLMWVVFTVFIIFELIVMLFMNGITLVRTLEIAIRASVAPLALSDTFAGNITNSHAIGFIRSFAALCLQGLFISICANIIPVFMAGAFNNMDSPWLIIGVLLNMIILSVATLLLMFRSGSIAKDILGAR